MNNQGYAVNISGNKVTIDRTLDNHKAAIEFCRYVAGSVKIEQPFSITAKYKSTGRVKTHTHRANVSRKPLSISANWLGS